MGLSCKLALTKIPVILIRNCLATLLAFFMLMPGFNLY